MAEKLIPIVLNSSSQEITDAYEQSEDMKCPATASGLQDNHVIPPQSNAELDAESDFAGVIDSDDD